MLLSLWPPCKAGFGWEKSQPQPPVGIAKMVEMASACHGPAQEPRETTGGAPQPLASPQPLLGP